MPPFRTRLARYLRRTMSPTQSRLWERLRMRRVGGWKFRRQHPIGPHFVDFYCPAARLVVQIVAPPPEANSFFASGRSSTTGLVADGYRVMEVHTADVEANLDGVVDAIDRELRSLGAPIPRRSRRNASARSGEPDQRQRYGGWE
jgi:very-short-patch-repair endonuclease